jgi:hypothetical protein
MPLLRLEVLVADSSSAALKKYFVHDSSGNIPVDLVSAMLPVPALPCIEVHRC